MACSWGDTAARAFAALRRAGAALGPPRVGLGLRRVQRVRGQPGLHQVVAGPARRVRGRRGQGRGHRQQQHDYGYREQLAHGAHHLCVSGSKAARRGGARADARGGEPAQAPAREPTRTDEARANRRSECDGDHTSGVRPLRLARIRCRAVSAALQPMDVAARPLGRLRARVRCRGDRAPRHALPRALDGRARAARERRGRRAAARPTCWARCSRWPAAAGVRGGVAGAVRRAGAHGRGRLAARRPPGRRDRHRRGRLARLPGGLRAGRGGHRRRLGRGRAARPGHARAGAALGARPSGAATWTPRRPTRRPGSRARPLAEACAQRWSRTRRSRRPGIDAPAAIAPGIDPLSARNLGARRPLVAGRALRRLGLDLDRPLGQPADAPRPLEATRTPRIEAFALVREELPAAAAGARLRAGAGRGRPGRP